MYMRLGFAVAIHVDPDVLLVDEVLAVGDEGFTHKCLDKFAEFKRRGKTILLVTHSLGLVERFCDEALWLDAGSMKALGDPKRVVGAYITDVERQRGAAARGRRREGAGIGDGDLTRRAGVGGAARQPDRNRDRPGGHVPGDRRPLGIARGRDHRRDADRRRRRARRTCFTAASRSTSASGCARRSPIDDFVDRHRPLQRRRRLLLRHQHRHRGAEGRADLRRRRSRVHDRQPRSRRGHLQARRRRPQARRLSLRLPPPAAHVPREVAHQGRRHLSAAARVAVLGRR